MKPSIRSVGAHLNNSGQGDLIISSNLVLTHEDVGNFLTVVVDDIKVTLPDVRNIEKGHGFILHNVSEGPTDVQPILSNSINTPHVNPGEMAWIINRGNSWWIYSPSTAIEVPVEETNAQLRLPFLSWRGPFPNRLSNPGWKIPVYIPPEE